MWTKTQDGSIVDTSGKVIYFSTDRFVHDICLGDCCFICGAKPSEKKFNNEHILPEWLLRRFDLFGRTITLPTGIPVRYDRYTVPCCAECNSLMGEVVETPISEVVQGGAQAVNDFASKNLLKLFVWMGLIFLKTHLKDRSHRVHLDKRKGDEKIADEYEWEQLHHIHCVVRCFYNGCTVDQKAIGSFLSVPVRAPGSSDRFDFGDLYLPQTMLLRLADVAMSTVFNDSGGAMSYFWQKLEKITGPLSALQLREVMVELAYLNLHLKTRPTFQTECDIIEESCRIIATRPKLDFPDMDRKVRGKLLHHAVQHALPHLQFVGYSQEEVLAGIKAGNFSFLFNNKGEFIADTWVPLLRD
jgi:hypothetical protein